MAKAVARSRIGWGLVLALAGATNVVSCGGEEAIDVPPDDTVSVRQALTLQMLLPLPQQLNPSDVAVGASNGVFINDRARVEGRATVPGSASTPYSGLVSDMGTGQMRIGVSATVGTVLSRGAPMIANNARIQGSLYTSQPPQYQNRSTVVVTGFVKENQAFTLDQTWLAEVTWPAVINPPVNLDPVNPPTPATFNLAPGAYQSVSVKSGRTLVLRAGQYFFGPWFQEPNSGLFIDASQGAVTVYMMGSFTFRGTISGNNERGRSGLTILSFDSGLQAIERSFVGTVVAPLGTIKLDAGSTGTFVGAYIGRVVSLHEGNVVIHERDPSSFRGFGPADRVSVTGGIIQRGTTLTDDFEQAEAVAVISRNGSVHNVTVSYNDRSQDPTSPRIEYPAGRDGDQRIVRKGVSLMGWSYSVGAINANGGYTFHYGGRVAPPTGWAAIWGDPALAKLDLDDPNVYLGHMAASTASFESTVGYDPATQTIVNATPRLDGHCIARSTDRGVTFPTVGCVVAGTFHDGTSLAVARDNTGRRQVYLTGHDCGPSGCTGSASVWRMDGETMTFTRLPNPFSVNISLHPRLRQVNGTLYVVALSGTTIIANRLNALTNSTTWLGQVTVVPSGAAAPNLPLADGRSLRQANPFSFDVGVNGAGQPRFRVIYTAASASFPGSFGLRTRECSATLTGCAAAPWTLDGLAMNITPAMKHFGGRWVTTWWRRESGSSAVSTLGALLNESTSAFDLRALGFPTNPCAAHVDGNSFYWGDYNEIDAYGDGRFFAPFTVNGPTCRFAGEWTADMHVGAAIFSF